MELNMVDPPREESQRWQEGFLSSTGSTQTVSEESVVFGGGKNWEKQQYSDKPLWRSSEVSTAHQRLLSDEMGAEIPPEESLPPAFIVKS